MKRAPAGLVFAMGLGLFSPLASAQAQTPPTAPSADDAAMAAQKAAFLALPEATRKAAQEALVWLGLYVGVNDGDFGKRTRDAILAFQASVKAPADGALSAPELKALLAAAQKAREAAGFQVVSDPKTGAKIGAPLKLLNARFRAQGSISPRTPTPTWARSIRACPRRRPPARSPTRRSSRTLSSSSRGRTGPVKFYTRFDKNPAANPPIRGFTFAYPASQTADLDRIAIAIANSFEPFPESAAAPAASAAARLHVEPAAARARSAARRDRARRRRPARR